MFTPHPFRFGMILLLFAMTACNPFRRDSAVELDPENTTLNTQWNATLASPEALAGITQMNGHASMAPSPDSTSTIVTINLANASPGGVHPWSARRGACGSSFSSPVVGSMDAYESLEVDSNGRASARVSIPTRTPTSGQYFVVVHASRANASTVVACGNLAAPAR
jgi:hypothetical protein